MATCNVNQLLAAAENFQGLTPGQMLAMETELLYQAQGENIPIATLMADGKCFGCLTEGQLLAVKTVLACNWANG